MGLTCLVVCVSEPTNRKSPSFACFHTYRCPTAVCSVRRLASSVTSADYRRIASTKSEGIDQYIGYLFVLRLPVYGSDLKRLVRLLQMGNGRDTLPHKHPHGSKDAECAGRSAGMTDQSLRRRDIHSSEKLCKNSSFNTVILECTCAMCNNSARLA